MDDQSSIVKRTRTGAPLFVAASLILLAWGVFAFGAVYTWAHVPLLTFSLAVSALGFLGARGSGEGGLRPYRPLAICLAVTLAAAAVQVLPLRPSTITAISPARDDADYPRLYAQATLREYTVNGQQPPGTLSIEPSRTRLGIAFLVCLGILLFGAANGFTGARPTAFVRGVIAIGVLAALAELAQLVLTGPSKRLVYGVFPPFNDFAPSAPFLNRNHTAGFLVMAVSISMGYLASSVVAGLERVKPEWRDRILWFGSSAGSESVLVALAVMVMSTAVIATQSRSGAIILALATVTFAFLIVRRQRSRGGRLIVLGVLALAVASALNAGGAGRVLERFAGDDSNRGGRSATWRSALAQARDFAVTGTGLNTFGVASIHYQRPENRLASTDIEAHNEYLQIASEGGLLLGLPALACIVSLCLLIRRRFVEGRDDARTYWLRVGATIALAAIACQSLVEFTLQMPGAATMFVLLAAVALHRPASRARTS